MIDRRTFLAGTGAVLLATPLAVEAQQKSEKIARVGWLYFGHGQSPEERAQYEAEAARSSFRLAMRELGWVYGQNFVAERRFGESADQLHAAAAELVRLKVDVVVVVSGGLAAIAHAETRTIPIVVVSSGFDLVTAGLAASLARPGGNVTGAQVLSTDLIGKRLQLLKELLPNLSHVATLGESVTNVQMGPTAQKSYAAAADAAARTLGITVDPFLVDRPEDFPAVFRRMTAKGDRGLVVYSSPFMAVHSRQIIDLAAKHRIADIYEDKYWAKGRGLMSYGPNYVVMLRHSASYVDKILKGAKPGDLPIEQPTTFELVINLKTAKALGLTIPPSLLGRADEVIE